MNQLCIQAFGGFEFEEMCRLAKEAGFDGVFSGDGDSVNAEAMRKNRQIVDQYSLYYQASHSKMKGCTGLWKDQESAEEYEATLRTCIDNCAENNVPILVVHVQAGVPVQQELGMSVLARGVRYAGERGVKIAFENIGNVQLLYDVLDTFKEPHVGFCYDSGHELCFLREPEDYLSRVGDRLICTHFHSNDGQFQHDNHWLPYEGVVDFDRIAAQLKELNYQGAITLEVAYHHEMGKEEYMAKAFERAKRLRDAVLG